MTDEVNVNDQHYATNKRSRGDFAICSVMLVIYIFMIQNIYMIV